MKPSRKGFSAPRLSRMITGDPLHSDLCIPLRNFPQFGHIRRADFRLAEGVDHLNHGGYGAPPRCVLDTAQRWRLQMEADPSTFFRRDLSGLLRGAAGRVAGFASLPPVPSF